MPFPCADSLHVCPRVGKISNLWLISQPSVGISGPALFYLYHGHVSFWLALMPALPKYLHSAAANFLGRLELRNHELTEHNLDP